MAPETADGSQVDDGGARRGGALRPLPVLLVLVAVRGIGAITFTAALFALTGIRGVRT